VLQEADRVALQNRHAAAFGLEYGPDGSSSGALGVLSASSTGTGSGYAQIIPIDPVKGTFDATPDPMKAYQVAQYADVAGLAAATLRDPGQARAFFKAVHALPNPSYQNTAGFMPEVKTFNISAVAGYANPSTDNMESLTFALLPSVWDPAYTTTPGAATPNVPPGPSPAPPAGTPVTNPSGPSAGTGTGGQDTGGTSGTGASSVTGGSGGVHAPGYGTGLSTSSGCGCTTAGADQTSGLTGLGALGLGFVFLGIRRRSQKKGS
ncbi:MAG TPA: MYXO-CTERM sorting domain-containing protein, partial [Polyangiaceae bacterium]